MGKSIKQIKWWPHARQRLVERSLDEELVIAAIEQPDQVILMGKQKIIHKRYHNTYCHKDYLLRIFIKEHTEALVIRTVYRTSKISKYWRDEL